MRILIVNGLDVPVAAIRRQARGNRNLEMKLAASYGFQQACQDLANKKHFAIEE